MKGTTMFYFRINRLKIVDNQQFPVSFQRASIGSSCIVDHGRQIAIEPMKWTS